MLHIIYMYECIYSPPQALLLQNVSLCAPYLRVVYNKGQGTSWFLNWIAHHCADAALSATRLAGALRSAFAQSTIVGAGSVFRVSVNAKGDDQVAGTGFDLHCADIDGLRVLVESFIAIRRTVRFGGPPVDPRVPIPPHLASIRPFIGFRAGVGGEEAPLEVTRGNLADLAMAQNAALQPPSPQQAVDFDVAPGRLFAGTAAAGRKAAQAAVVKFMTDNGGCALLHPEEMRVPGEDGQLMLRKTSPEDAPSAYLSALQLLPAMATRKFSSAQVYDAVYHLYHDPAYRITIRNTGGPLLEVDYASATATSSLAFARDRQAVPGTPTARPRGRGAGGRSAQ